MDVSSPQDLLQRTLAQVSRAVATKTTYPVLSNVLIDADGETLKLAATNQEIGITSMIPAQVDEPGRVTVDARLLSEFVNTLPSEPVRFSMEPGRLILKVKGVGADAEINGIDAEEFPICRGWRAGAFTANVDPQVLREMISHVEFAAATDDSRPVLAGVLIRLEDDRITMAAADGFRLAVRDGELTTPVPERLDIIVPARALRELARIVGDRTEPIDLTVTPNRAQLVVHSGETEFYSRLIDGTFPDFRQIVPREFATRLEVGRDEFLAAVRRAGFFARDNNDVVRLSAKADADELAPGNSRSVRHSRGAREQPESCAGRDQWPGRRNSLQCPLSDRCALDSSHGAGHDRDERAKPGRGGEAARVGDLHVRHHAHGHRRSLTLLGQQC